MNNDTIIIYGSSRKDGNTFQSVQALNDSLKARAIDLLGYNIGYYDYEYSNQDDDFIQISRQMIAAQKIIFATPIYWYSMSAPMKVFFDRLSDLVRIRKEEGRNLKGKEMYVLVNGSVPEMPDYFTKPFESTSAYLDMQYCGHCFFYNGGDEELLAQSQKAIQIFAQKIQQECKRAA